MINYRLIKMFGVKDYYQTARENEAVFRNMLKDLRDNRENRPMGIYVPKDLETEAELDGLFEKYSEGHRQGRFTILNFKKPTEDSASISFEDVAILSGGGAELEYKVNEDNSVEYQKMISNWMS